MQFNAKIEGLDTIYFAVCCDSTEKCFLAGDVTPQMTFAMEQFEQVFNNICNTKHPLKIVVTATDAFGLMGALVVDEPDWLPDMEWTTIWLEVYAASGKRMVLKFNPWVSDDIAKATPFNPLNPQFASYGIVQQKRSKYQRKQKSNSWRQVNKQNIRKNFK